MLSIPKIKVHVKSTEPDKETQLKIISKIYTFVFTDKGDGEEEKTQGTYGEYTENEYRYLWEIGGEQTTYEGFVAVAYVVLNRMEKWGKPIEDDEKGELFHARQIIGNWHYSYNMCFYHILQYRKKRTILW